MEKISKANHEILHYDNEKNGFILIIVLVVLIVLIALWMHLSGPSRGTLAWYIERLQLGMNEQEVRTFVPTQYFRVAGAILPCPCCTNSQHYEDLTRCLQTNSPVATMQTYTDIESSMGIAGASVFFSPDGSIVGWRFSASGAEMPRGGFKIEATVPVVELGKQKEAGQPTTPPYSSPGAGSKR